MACRLTADAQLFSRTANLPSEVSFSMMCWAMQYVDTNANAVIISLDNNAGDAYTIEAAADGTTISLSAPSGSLPSFACQPALRQAFFVALTCDGTTINGYLRRAGDTRLDTVVETTIGAFTATGFSCGNFRPTPTGNGFRGSVWNFKLFDRVLSPYQLLVESQYDEVFEARDCNLFWRLKHPGDLVDYGPRGQRRPTRVSTPTPSGDHLKVPLLRRTRPGRRAFVAPAAGGFFSRYYYDMIGANRV